jgi:hypothetical protein
MSRLKPRLGGPRRLNLAGATHKDGRLGESSAERKYGFFRFWFPALTRWARLWHASGVRGAAVGILLMLNLNPHPLQKSKTQRVRHPENRSVA